MKKSEIPRPTYREWRNRAVQACSEPWVHEFFASGEHGPEGEELGVDVFTRAGNPDAPWVIQVSGTHGVEGYLGSDVQTAILNHPGLKTPFAQANLLLIHGLNSYGMAWYRRANANNVDLNRNSIDHGTEILEWPQVYADLHKVRADLSAIKVVYGFFKELFRSGFTKIISQFGSGQSLFPDALFYAGSELQSEIRLLQTVFKKHIDSKTSANIYFIDLHSGLGPFGRETLFLDGHGAVDEKSNWQAAWQKFPIDPRDSRLKYKAPGLLSMSVRRFFSHAHVNAVVQEFGTLPMPPVFLTLLRENAGFLATKRGSKPDPAITQEMLAAFYPNQKNWRSNCRALAVQRFIALCDYLETGQSSSAP